MEKISAYIPCYNAEKFIVKAVESILAQTLSPDEILVIDDGCTDRSMELIAKFPVKVISMEGNQGLAAARNRAYKEVKNELIACIDADCEAHPEWLEQLAKAFPRDCVGTGGKTIEVNQKEMADRWRAQHMPLHWGDKCVINPKVIYGANQLFRKSSIFQVGLLDTSKVTADYKIGYEDLELARKLYHAGYKLFYNPKAVVYHLRNDTPASIIRQYWRWSVFYYPEPTRLPVFFLKLGINLLKAVKHVVDDIIRREPRLIPISLRIFPFHATYDFQHLRNFRNRHAKLRNSRFNGG
jgi:glycosyltransferase involved in cell wall biosynthesis